MVVVVIDAQMDFISCLFPAEIGEEHLQRGILMCSEMLQVAAVLEPGLSVLRGCLLLNLHGVLLERARRRRDPVSTEGGSTGSTPRARDLRSWCIAGGNAIFGWNPTSYSRIVVR